MKFLGACFQIKNSAKLAKNCLKHLVSTKKKDRNCPVKYINEQDLCEVLLGFIEKNHDKIHITSKLQAKVEKHYAITKTLFSHYGVDTKLSTPFVEYSRYVLLKGGFNEQLNYAKGIKHKLSFDSLKLKLIKS